jgi:hypothetical protein
MYQGMIHSTIFREPMRALGIAAAQMIPWAAM